MGSKGRWSPSQSLAERIYWGRTYTREIEALPSWPRITTAEQEGAAARAWAKAEAIATRYQRMKRRRTRALAALKRQGA